MDAATAAALSRARAALRAFAPPWRPLLAHRFAPPACTAQPSACIPSHMLASGVASRLQLACSALFGLLLRTDRASWPICRRSAAFLCRGRRSASRRRAGTSGQGCKVRSPSPSPSPSLSPSHYHRMRMPSPSPLTCVCPRPLALTLALTLSPSPSRPHPLALAPSRPRPLALALGRPRSRTPSRSPTASAACAPTMQPTSAPCSGLPRC